MCVGTISYSTRNQGEKGIALIDLLKTKGYKVYPDTHVNTLFVLKTFQRR